MDACAASGGWSEPVERLLRGGSFLAPWVHTEAEWEHSGLQRYRLTEEGKWFSSPLRLFDEVLEPLASVPDGQADVLLALWSANSYEREFTHVTKVDRRELMALQFSEASVHGLVCEEPGLTVPELRRAADVLAASARAHLHWPTVSDAQIDAALKALIARGLVRTMRPRQPVLIRPAFWERPTGVFTALRRSVTASESLEEYAKALYVLLSGRPSANRKRDGQDSASPRALAEARNLGVVHDVLTEMMRAHPQSIWGTGSLWAISPFVVYAEGQRFCGSPAALSPLRPDGSTNPAVRVTQRIVDGVVWLAGDAPREPSVHIEYEGSDRNRLSIDHLMTALTMSTQWGKPIVLLFIVSTQARDTVITHCRGLLASQKLRGQELGFPNATVAVRVVSQRDATKGSALLAEPLWAADFLIRNGTGHHLVLTTD